MPNAIKYNVSAETLALKKGNFWIGTGDVGKGPTSSTGYYNGITPPTGGYTIYLNKATGGPSIYTVTTEAQMVSLTNSIGSQSFTTSGQCLNWFATQSDKMIFNRDYEPIITNGLVMNLDAGFTPSYPTTGTTWYDISGNGNHCTLINGPSFNNGVFTLDGSNDNIQTINTLDLTETNAVTFMYFLQVQSYTQLVALHELSSNFNGNAGTFVASYCDNSVGQNNEVFASLFGNNGYNIAVYNKSMLNDLEWHQHVVIHDTSQSSVENLIYGDGESGPVIINPVNGYANNNTNNFKNEKLYIGSRGGNSFFAHMKLGQVLLYNRALSASEILQNYNATKSRFGL
jgi:hypothetical protein